MTFGESLRQIREERGMTQEQLAEFLGTTKQVISRYEIGQRVPKLTVAQEYARRLGVTLDRIAGDPGAQGLEELIRDEPFAAYDCCKEHLTRTDKEDIARLIRLRAELNRNPG